MPINVPVRVLGSVCFWFSFSGEVMCSMGFRSANVSAVSGSARSVPPIRVCRKPWRV